MQDVVLAPADFVALFNQTLEMAYPAVVIEGELANFRVSKGRWVYFDLQDEQASVKFFGTVYNLPGPLEDGLSVQVLGTPRMHPRFGFSINVVTIAPVGQGSIKKAADLLRAKLEKEGLFAPERKRALPEVPARIGLITAASSAAYADFIKILGERWGGLQIELADVYVQGTQAPPQIVKAIDFFSKQPELVDVLVITRGGGSADDLAAFSDERVVRAVAASRIPTLVAIGHEVDISLAELAADQRASTPSNAAQIIVPNRQQILASLSVLRHGLIEQVADNLQRLQDQAAQGREYLTSQVNLLLKDYQNKLISDRRLLSLYDPKSALKRGYAIVKKGNQFINKTSQVKPGDGLNLQLSDGMINATAQEIIK